MTYHIDRTFDLIRDELRRAGKPEPTAEEVKSSGPYEDPDLTDDDVRKFRNVTIGGLIGGCFGGPIGAVAGAGIGSIL